MQSTKKAPLRKEDGTLAAGDDAATIAQSAAGPNTTQPVRCTPSVCGGELVFIWISCLLLYLPWRCCSFLTIYCSLSSSHLFPLFPHTTPHTLLLFSSHLILKIWICPATSLLRTVTLNFACVAGLLKGRGRWGPSDKRGQQREQGKKKKVNSNWKRAAWEPGTCFHSAFFEKLFVVLFFVQLSYMTAMYLTPKM